MTGSVDQGAIIGLWSGRFDTGLVYADKALRELFGLGLDGQGDGVPLATLLENVVPADRPRLQADMARAATVGTSFYTTYRVNTFQGVRRVATCGQCFLGQDGRADHYHGITLDSGEEGDARSPRAEVVDHLMAAREAAGLAGDRLLGRLIEAVMLEAGRGLAEEMKHSVDGGPSEGPGGA